MVDTKECTLMFYFASDNPLAISVVSQLKAIKAAGFHKQANVVVQFDPFTEGTPTHIFDVNLMNKVKAKEESRVPLESNDPLERNLIEDKLWNGQKTRDGKPIREAIAQLLGEHASKYNPPEPPIVENTDTNGNRQEYGPKRSLEEFLKFCAEHYPAKHYLLFILGHGVVVGNDVFLFDENAAEPTLKLQALHKELYKFKSAVKAKGGEFDFIGFHSCSVSSLEVAYELKDIARYMLASQGTAFVGSWPYRQILMRVFEKLNTHKQLTPPVMKQLLIDTFYFCMHNSADFILAGYPFDLSLFDLSKIDTIKGPLDRLSRALVNGLENPRCVDLIQLAHLKSQSFYQEMYTDLYDFCFCLARKIEDYEEQESEMLKPIFDACLEVMTVLEKQMPTKGGRPSSESPDKLVVCSEFAGAEYQYARGLSLYFPWSAPISTRRILVEYEEYRLNDKKDFETTWLDFLKLYLNKTRRLSQRAERRQESLTAAEERPISAKDALAEDKVSLIYMEEGPRNGENALGRTKTDASDPTGGDCSCPSIKNYPSDIRDRDARRLKKARDDSAAISENMAAQSAI
jgi:hypothetical protein